MDDLVFLAQRIPYPPNKGDKLRAWNILRRLAVDYRIHLACFVDDPHDWRYEPAVREVCETALVLPLKPPLAKLRSLQGLLSGEAMTRHYFHDPRVSVWLAELRRRLRRPKAFVFSSGMAHYVMGRDWIGLPRLVDMVDVDSDKWRQYAGRRTGAARWIYRREAETLLAHERTIAAATDATIFVSAKEAELFRQLSPETAGKVHVVRNGVDAEFFDPARDYENPYDPGARPIVFTGAMDYWPNVDATVWFAREILPAIRQAEPRAEFCIAGANPAPEVLALNGVPGVRITGRVPDVRPYLAHARVAVAPLRVARGVQNKVLEGLAMAKPVVATQSALNGIVAFSGDSLGVAEQAEAFAARTLERLGDGAAGHCPAARQYVLANYSWDASAGAIRGLLEG